MGSRYERIPSDPLRLLDDSDAVMREFDAWLDDLGRDISIQYRLILLGLHNDYAFPMSAGSAVERYAAELRLGSPAVTRHYRRFLETGDDSIPSAYLRLAVAARVDERVRPTVPVLREDDDVNLRDIERWWRHVVRLVVRREPAALDDGTVELLQQAYGVRELRAVAVVRYLRRVADRESLAVGEVARRVLREVERPGVRAEPRN